MTVEDVVLKRVKGAWRVCVRLTGGRTWQYAYRTERQARYFAAIFRMGPPFLPGGGQLRPKPRRPQVEETPAAKL